MAETFSREIEFGRLAYGPVNRHTKFFVQTILGPHLKCLGMSESACSPVHVPMSSTCWVLPVEILPGNTIESSLSRREISTSSESRCKVVPK